MTVKMDLDHNLKHEGSFQVLATKQLSQKVSIKFFFSNKLKG